MSPNVDAKNTAMATPSRGYKWTVILSITLIFSVMLNVLLAHRIRSQKSIQSATTSEYRLKVGTILPPIGVRRLDGQPEVIAYRNTRLPTVLYIFTPTCVWCERNMDNLKRLLETADGRYRFIGLSLSEADLAEYVSKNELKVPVYSGLSPETLKAYKLGGTPQTIVVSPEGKVLQDWMGAYVGDQKTQVEAFFHVELPGVPAQERGNAAPQTN